MSNRFADAPAIEAEQQRIRQMVDRALSEREWQAELVRTAEAAGWWCWHDADSRRNKAGLPDLIAIRGPRLLFIEVKAERGTLRPAQVEFFNRLRGVTGVEFYVFRPSDRAWARKVLE